MGFRTKIANYFKSPEELAKEERVKLRRKYFEIQNRIDAMESDIAELKDKAKNFWNQAKDMMRQGQKQRAAELVRAHDELEERITLKFRKSLYFMMVMEKLNDSATDTNVINCIQEYAKSLGLDSSAADVQMHLDDIQIASAGIDDIDKSIDRAINRDMNLHRSNQPTEIKASEDSMRLLESELAGEMNAESNGGVGAASDVSQSHASGNDVEAQVNAGLEEIRALMGNNPKS